MEVTINLPGELERKRKLSRTESIFTFPDENNEVEERIGVSIEENNKLIRLGYIVLNRFTSTTQNENHDFSISVYTPDNFELKTLFLKKLKSEFEV